MAKLKEGSTVDNKKIVVTNEEINIKITFGTDEPDPSQMEEGEVYFQYE